MLKELCLMWYFRLKYARIEPNKFHLFLAGNEESEGRNLPILNKESPSTRIHTFLIIPRWYSSYLPPKSINIFTSASLNISVKLSDSWTNMSSPEVFCYIVTVSGWWACGNFWASDWLIFPA